MIVYRDPHVIVENRLLRGWLVTEIANGRQVRPSREQADQVARAWHHIRTNFRKVPKWRDPAEADLMRLFADACLYPASPVAATFLADDPVTLAAQIVDAVIITRR